MTITAAYRAANFPVPPPNSAHARSGLRYERALRKSLAESSACLFIYNPAFHYITANSHIRELCIPDFILTGLDFLHPGDVVVVECKLTYTPAAAQKLIDVYVPVIARALCASAVWPVMVAKNLTRTTPPPFLSLKTALRGRLEGTNPCNPPNSPNSVPLVHWLGRGGFPIGA